MKNLPNGSLGFAVAGLLVTSGVERTREPLQHELWNPDFDVDVTGDSKLFLWVQDADPNP